MSLELKLQEFNKKYKTEIGRKGIDKTVHPRIPFTSPRANYMLYGGIPRGRMVEFFGPFSSGKTTTALDVIANAQMLFEAEAEADQEPQKVLFVDSEHTLDYDWAKQLGVDTDNLYVIDPLGQSAEQLFQMILEIIEGGDVGLIVLDSLGNLVSQQAMDKTMEEKTMAGISAALTMFCKKACPLLKQTNCTFLGINQVIMDMNSMYNMYKTPGGENWKLNCSVRIQFSQGKLFDEKGAELPSSAECPSGNLVDMKIIKTKICKPNRKRGTYSLNFVEGIDKFSDLFDIAQKEGIIQGAGWFSFLDTESGEYLTEPDGKGVKPIKVQGKPGVIKRLKEDEELLAWVEERINKIIEGI